MTLDEAIKHAKEQAEELGCTTCGQEHLQLAKWLEELKQYKQKEKKLSIFWKIISFVIQRLIRLEDKGRIK